MLEQQKILKQTRIHKVDRYWQVRASLYPESIKLQIWFREALIMTYQLQQSDKLLDDFEYTRRFLFENLIDDNGNLKGLDHEAIATDEKAGIGYVHRVLEEASKAIVELRAL